MFDRSKVVPQLLEAFGLAGVPRRGSSLAFSSFAAPAEWRAQTYTLTFPFYYVEAPNAKFGEVRSFSSGIKADNYVLIAETGTAVYVIFRRARGGESPLIVSIRNEEDLDRTVQVVRRLKFTGNILCAHSSIDSAFGLLRAGAERYFTNRGLFSTYYLRERLFKALDARGRRPQKEAAALLEKFGGGVPTDPDSAVRVLEAMGYLPVPVGGEGHPQYALRHGGATLDAGCIVAAVESLDIKPPGMVVPSYQAISLLREHQWVILTNGRLWRLYSDRIASSSTNYFEVDVEGITSEGDNRLLYFVSLFSSAAFKPDSEGASDLDVVYEGGLRYAKDVEDKLRTKVFEKELFTNLVKATLDHSPERRYSQAELDGAKERSLRLLYRLLFVLYAESRNLLPLNNPKYREISVDNLRARLSALEKEPDSTSAWDCLKLLFRVISLGSEKAGVQGANVPEYDGELFAEDPSLDGLSLKNRFVVPALRDLCETDGRGIDYQNLGVRHLGSLYEALLEYTVRQADRDLVIYNGKMLDGAFAADLKSKPHNFIQRGDLYLSAGGLARKGTGSYYTPDAIVRFLVRKGLEPHFALREKLFAEDMARLRASKTDELERKTVDDLLSLKVVDPAMGSGHFLVAVVDEITNWAISLLRQYPDAPLAKMIDDDRKRIVEEQRGKGVALDGALLTDSVILKRMVMKRCVYGCDINPLAVELAKLSLWLDSFTIGTPLTFLDHHIRCGDSLMGLWRSSIKDRGQRSLQQYIEERGQALAEGTSRLADLTLGERARSRTVYNDHRRETAPSRVFLNTRVAGEIEPGIVERIPRYLAPIEEAYAKPESERAGWWGGVVEASSLAERYRAFHWEFEFPDAFFGGSGGFDLVIMNPPWEAVKPEDDDFFSTINPDFRRMSSKPEKRKEMDRLLRDEEVARAYQDYRKRIEQRAAFYKSEEYSKRGSGDTNLWKLFLERGLKLLAKGGSLAVIVPSGIVTDEGAKALREALFEGRIRLLYEFENALGIFPDVHRSYKFTLLVWDKSSPTQAFPAAFYLHDMDALSGKKEQDKFLEMPLELVRKSAPDSLSIPEVRNKEQLAVFAKLYENNPLLGDSSKGWSVSLVRELDRTNDSDLFRTDGKGWPLIEGKHFHQFIPNYEKPTFTVDPKEGLERTKRHREYHAINEKVHDLPRLAFRGVASSTNIRSMICCILPPKCFVSGPATIVHSSFLNKTFDTAEYLKYISLLAGVFNSYIFDFLVRQRISMRLNFFYVYQTPVPLYSANNKYVREIIELTNRLSFTDSHYEEAARLVGMSVGELAMRERIEYTAKLNALVAISYSLTRSEYETILNSFDGFEEDPNLVNMQGEIKWNDGLMRRFNGEVRSRTLKYYDELTGGT